MATQFIKGWLQQFMISFFKKEATYGAGVTMDDTNACSLKRFEAEVEYPDVMDSDKEEVTNTEHGTDQAIIEQRVKFTVKEPKTKPNTIAGFAALAMGSVTTTTDVTAESHKIVPVAVGTELPSVGVEGIKGGIQKEYRGIKCNTFKLMGTAGEFIGCEAELIGSGYRVNSATAFAAVISESVLPANLGSAWLESGGDISIDAVLTQGAQNISSGVPEAIKARLMSFEFMWNNNLGEIPGFGGAGLLQDQDYVRRAVDLKFQMLFKDETELNHYLNQDALALEIDVKGAAIAGSSSFYGVQLVIARFKMKLAGLPQGGVNDTLLVDIEADVQDDGTNPPAEIEVVNTQAAYLAA